MMAVVTAVGLVAAVGAAAVHVLIFWMESIAWEGPLARRAFGGTPEEARPLLGVALVVLGAGSAFRAGTALVLYGTGSMVAAALVLGLCSPAHRGAALKQGALPALAIICLCAGLLPA